MSPMPAIEGRDVILAAWLLLVVACLIGSVVAFFAMPTDAIDLTISISGTSSGQGMHTMSFSGEVIRVNVSQENETSWNVTADGGQHDI